MSNKLTGGFVNYYLVKVDHPQREEQAPYQAECEDIIQALGMTFDEGCLFKALWRTAAARQGNGKPGHKALYDAEKMVHYAKRNLKKVQLESEPKEINKELISGDTPSVSEILERMKKNLHEMGIKNPERFLRVTNEDNK